MNVGEATSDAASTSGSVEPEKYFNIFFLRSVPERTTPPHMSRRPSIPSPNYSEPKPFNTTSTNNSEDTVFTAPLSDPSLSLNSQLQLHTPVRINRQTKAAFVCNHAVDAYVEYPYSSENSRIAHKFAVNPNPTKFVHPKGNIVYGLGAPMGQHDNRLCELLTDHAGVKVACKETTLTCQGVKICDRSDPSLREVGHSEYAVTESARSAGAVLLKKTVALKAALDKNGCGCLRDEMTLLSCEEREQLENRRKVIQQERRGQPLRELCEGRLIFDRYKDNKAFIRCEHYTSASRRHLIDHRVQETNDIYMEAMFDNDQDEIARIKDLARLNNYGPLLPCFTVANSSSMRAFCLYEPYDLTACPFVLIVVSGTHTHLPPLPLSTPIRVEATVLDLLHRMGHELADATPRRFMRHPAILSRLRELIPIPNPTLIDLHLSLANKDHIRIYIRKAKNDKYPAGTDWEGIVRYKIDQDLDKVREERYLRVVKEIPNRDNEDEGPLRVILCMTKPMSRRLIAAKWIQSDIGFKRELGALEFELVGWDRERDRSDVYARAFLNRQTAEAHRILFHLIDSIVLEDTGRKLQWRHIHSVMAVKVHKNPIYAVRHLIYAARTQLFHKNT
ncbi:hypothetical protein K439DRAFT_1610695 [Ramaria rubella]|nr:hypothetical protein K439DRAFT_1610695 [Ramaria rubella]